MVSNTVTEPVALVSFQYGPVYIGTFLCLFLAEVTLARLYVEEGQFIGESLFWFIGNGLSLWLGWLETRHHRAWIGKLATILQWLAVALTLLILVRTFNPVVGALYFLGILQLGRNLVLTTRKDLYYACIISFIIVLGVVSHYRADWGLMIYVVAYMLALFYTLLAEQLDNRLCQNRETALDFSQGRGLLPTAALGSTVSILLLALFFFAILPRPEALGLELVPDDQILKHAGEGESADAELSPLGKAGPDPLDSEGNDQGAGQSAWGSLAGNLRGLSARLRSAIRKPGVAGGEQLLVHTLAQAIDRVADLAEAMSKLQELLCDFLERNLKNILFALLIGLLLFALLILARHKQWIQRLQIHVDHWRLRRNRDRLAPIPFIRQCYLATERLLKYYGHQRHKWCNVRQYKLELQAAYISNKVDTDGFFDRFMDIRYGLKNANREDVEAMLGNYQEMLAFVMAENLR